MCAETAIYVASRRLLLRTAGTFSQVQRLKLGRSAAARCREGSGKVQGSAAARPRVADIAAEAHRVGRQRLATMLLEHEPNASDQVPSSAAVTTICNHHL